MSDGLRSDLSLLIGWDECRCARSLANERSQKATIADCCSRTSKDRDEHLGANHKARFDCASFSASPVSNDVTLEPCQYEMRTPNKPLSHPACVPEQTRHKSTEVSMLSFELALFSYVFGTFMSRFRISPLY